MERFANLPDGTYIYLVKLNSSNISKGGNVFKGFFIDNAVKFPESVNI